MLCQRPTQGHIVPSPALLKAQLRDREPWLKAVSASSQLHSHFPIPNAATVTTLPHRSLDGFKEVVTNVHSPVGNTARRSADLAGPAVCGRTRGLYREESACAKALGHKPALYGLALWQ